MIHATEKAAQKCEESVVVASAKISDTVRYLDGKMRQRSGLVVDVEIVGIGESLGISCAGHEIRYQISSNGTECGTDEVYESELVK